VSLPYAASKIGEATLNGCRQHIVAYAVSEGIHSRLLKSIKSFSKWTTSHRQRGDHESAHDEQLRL